MNAARDYALLALLGLMWGTLTPLARRVSQLGVPPLAYAVLITLIGGLLLLASRRGRLPLSRDCLRFYAVSGAIGSALPTANMFFVLGYLGAGTVAIIIAIAPIFTYLMALAVRVERFSMRRFAGVMTGLAGAVLLLNAAQRPSADGIEVSWPLLLAFATPLMYAANTVYAGKYRPAGADSLGLAAGLLLSSCVLLCVAALLTGQWPTPSAYSTEANVLTAVHGVVTAGAYSLFFALLALAGPVFTSQVGYVVTIVGVAVGMLFLGERHGIVVGVACATIFVGLALLRERVESARR